MSIQKKIPFVLLITVILFSCSTRKEKSIVHENLPAAVSDTVAVAADAPVDLHSYSKVYEQFATQIFTAAPKKISVLKGRKGLKVTVNPTALEKEDGTAVDGNITVKMIELTTSEELFKSNAATVSNGRLLVSGGSYYIGMESDGHKLRLKNNQSLQVEFPQLKNNEMELFYGSRDAAGNMNWEKAEEPLVISQQYLMYNRPYKDNTDWEPYKSKYHLYDSISAKVNFVDKTVTLKEMVEILQKRGIDKNIDTLFIPSNQFFGERYFASVRYNSPFVKKYRVISCKELEAEKDSLAKVGKIKAAHDEANRKYDEEWRKQSDDNQLTTQVQKYYAPAGVTRLGWINCDRFYKDQQNTEIPVEMPYTFNNKHIQYFLIYRSFNGLMSGILYKNSKQEYVLPALPQGETVTLVAFTKANGQIFQCKEEFVVQGNKAIKPEFKMISTEEMAAVFGKNVKI